ncbi:MAG: hypothetical protein RIQ79_1960 [Verrucomicrobiota bacterium]
MLKRLISRLFSSKPAAAPALKPAPATAKAHPRSRSKSGPAAPSPSSAAPPRAPRPPREPREPRAPRPPRQPRHDERPPHRDSSHDYVRPPSRPGERPPHFMLIDRHDQLAPFYAALDRVEEVAMDTEADNMFHFHTRVCLLQFLVAGEVYLVDLMTPLPLEPLWERLATKHLIMHGSDFDIRLLWELCRFRPKSIFDTMLAAQLLNRPRVGLGALLEQHFDLVLDKSGQKANWSKRPLTPKLLDYASLDVWHLPALRDLLTAELARLDRLDWLDQQCRRQIEAGLAGFPRDEENAWRVGPVDRLRGRGLSVLHAIWHWRQKWAEELDTPPFKVVNNEFLSAVAGAAEQGDSVESILAQVNLGKRQDRLLPSLRTALLAGLERDPTTLPRRPRAERIHLSVAEIARQDALKAYRDQVGAKIDLDPTLIAPRATLVTLCREPARLDEILLPWQADLLRDAPDLKLDSAVSRA